MQPSDKFKKYILDKQAERYIKKVLGAGKSLSKSVLRNINFTDGQMFTFLPKGLFEERIVKFETGGILDDSNMPRKEYTTPSGKRYLMVGVPNQDELLAKIIVPYLTINKHYFCLLEEILFTAKDKRIFVLGSKTIIKDEEIFYLLHYDICIQQNDILKVIRRAGQPWHFVGIIAEGSKDFIQSLMNTQKITEQDIENFCTNIKMLIIGAYDGEGYLFWEETKKHSF